MNKAKKETNKESDLEPKPQRKYAPPNVRVQHQLLDCLNESYYYANQYQQTRGTANMRNFMYALRFPFNYFIVYSEKQNCKNIKSDEDLKLLKKARAFYLFPKHRKPRITPEESNRLLEIITKISYESGLINVHQATKQEDRTW